MKYFGTMQFPTRLCVFYESRETPRHKAKKDLLASNLS